MCVFFEKYGNTLLIHYSPFTFLYKCPILYILQVVFNIFCFVSWYSILLKIPLFKLKNSLSFFELREHPFKYTSLISVLKAFI